MFINQLNEVEKIANRINRKHLRNYSNQSAAIDAALECVAASNDPLEARQSVRRATGFVEFGGKFFKDPLNVKL
jgi:hypothetical protein